MHKVQKNYIGQKMQRWLSLSPSRNLRLSLSLCVAAPTTRDRHAASQKHGKKKSNEATALHRKRTFSSPSLTPSTTPAPKSQRLASPRETAASIQISNPLPPEKHAK